ncbi:GNAT family N-acetyltransferase [Angustibacter luteus]|uniref:Enhanced intracellular survival protein Eis n=1 Tax=Angustibacter luteus TaxID=658456 RepID=A0ABW1J938_9ACTN
MTADPGLQHRAFPARCTDDGPDHQTIAWMTARFNGFLQDLPSAGQVASTAAAWQQEGRVLHAIYDVGSRPEAALGPDVPVATAAVIEASLDAGGDTDIACTLVADVTVRPTHRGQGLMRHIMQAITTRARETGVPLVALHAAHPALYARFGFSPAVRSLSVEADCARFALRSQPSGTVHAADPRRAHDLARTVAAASGDLRFGALTASSLVEHPPQGSDHATRCLVHVDDHGHVDGVLTYAFQGWTPQAQVLELRSETYAAVEAHAALWQTLASTGLASTVRATDVRTDDPLPWLLVDRAAWRVTGMSDGYSLRILDAATAMRLRGYSGPDAEIAIDVEDPGGPTAGRWLLQVSGGRAAVETTARPADLTMDVQALAAAFLGTTAATVLHGAGLVTGSQAAARALDDLLRGPVAASSSLHF